MLGEDMAGFARELQDMAGNGGFDPLSMFAGQTRFHSVFLAPLSPALTAARAQFLADGSGPLVSVVTQMEEQGLSALDAGMRAREMFQAAQGMLVIVLANDQGLSTVPQLFFGHLSDEYQEHISAAFTKDFPESDVVVRSLKDLSQKMERGQWYTFSAPDEDDYTSYWAELAHDLLQGLEEGIMPGATDPLKDLAWWAASALQASPDENDGEELSDMTRCYALAGAIDESLAAATALFAEYEPEDEDVVVLIEALVKYACANNVPQAVADFLRQQWDELVAITGLCYELALPYFRAVAASGASSEALLQAAHTLEQADRKSFRHDLQREPLWYIHDVSADDLISVNEAAELVDRSIHFIAKRLEASTIPCHRNADGDVLIPRAGLLAWKKLMDHYSLLD